MRNIYIWVVCLIAVTLGVSCAQGQNADQGRVVNQERLRDHLAEYWRGVDVSALPEDTLEQKIVDYLFLTAHGDSVTRRQSWTELAAVFTESYPEQWVVDYLGDRESPLYAPALLDEYLVTLTDVLPADNLQRSRVMYLLENIRKNRAGAEIADIELAIPDGENSTLHSKITEMASRGAEEVVVLFYDPDCGECSRAISELSASGAAVVAVSITDEVKPLPAEWISSMAADPDELDDKYYLPEMPEIYRVTPAGIILQ